MAVFFLDDATPLPVHWRCLPGELARARHQATHLLPITGAGLDRRGPTAVARAARLFQAWASVIGGVLDIASVEWFLGNLDALYKLSTHALTSSNSAT